MADKYACYRDLARTAKENRDYRIISVTRESEVLIIAPHGGEIEPFTSAVASKIAGRTDSLYLFEGVKPSGNRDLHLTSHRFDEPKALEMVRRASIVISVHGEKDVHGRFAMAGGLDKPLSRGIAGCIAEAGFSIRAPENGMSAVHPLNICNRGKTGKGVQLEISYGLRKRLNQSEDMMQRFASAVRSVIYRFSKIEFHEESVLRQYYSDIRAGNSGPATR